MLIISLRDIERKGEEVMSKKRDVEHIKVNGKRYEHAKSFVHNGKDIMFTKGRAKQYAKECQRRGFLVRTISHKDSVDVYIKVKR